MTILCLVVQLSTVVCAFFYCTLVNNICRQHIYAASNFPLSKEAYSTADPQRGAKRTEWRPYGNRQTESCSQGQVKSYIPRIFPHRVNRGVVTPFPCLTWPSSSFTIATITTSLTFAAQWVPLWVTKDRTQRSLDIGRFPRRVSNAGWRRQIKVNKNSATKGFKAAKGVAYNDSSLLRTSGGEFATSESDHESRLTFVDAMTMTTTTKSLAWISCR